MDKLLVTGLSGFLGWHISNDATSNFEVYGTVNKNTPKSHKINMITCQLDKYSSIDSLFEKVIPNAVIHTAAISQPIECEKNVELSTIINTEASIYLAKKCRKLGIPFIFTSSDMIYDGRNAPYNEQSKTNPLNTYGKQKRNAEVEIAKIYPEATICRMPLMFGKASPYSHSFIQPIIKNLKENIKSCYFYDEYRTPISAYDVSNFFLKNIFNISGFFNLGGNERISRYEFGKEIAKVGGYDTNLIDGNSQKDVQFLALRPQDLTMDNSYAREKGFNPMQITEALKILHKDGVL